MLQHDIAIVHRERNLLRSLEMGFTGAGFTVRTFDDGAAALEALCARPAHLAILGRRMPGLDGPEVFRRMRRVTATPVIFLSYRGDDLADEVQGAMDYLSYPLSISLLVERARDVLEGGTGRLVIDAARRRCTWRRTRLYLTMPEFLMLEQLAKGGIHTRFALMEAAYGPDLEMDADLVDGHISGIRRRFREIDSRADPVEKVYGVGYRLKGSVMPG